MRTLVATLLVAALGAGAAPHVSAQVPLDVMTFNIRTASGRDGDNAWPHRKELVAATIERFAPQVVGLQEALDEQIEYLDAMLPDYRWLGIDRLHFVLVCFDIVTHQESLDVTPAGCRVARPS